MSNAERMRDGYARYSRRDFRGDQVASMHEVADTLGVARAAGMIPAMG